MRGFPLQTREEMEAAMDYLEDQQIDIERLIEKVDGPLPSRKEGLKEFWRLELTKGERNLLADALRKLSHT